MRVTGRFIVTMLIDIFAYFAELIAHLRKTEQIEMNRGNYCTIIYYIPYAISLTSLEM